MINGANIFDRKSSFCIVSVVELITIEANNRHTINRTAFAGLNLAPPSHIGFLFFVSNLRELRKTDLQNNPDKQKIERWNTLIGLVQAHHVFPPHLSKAFNLMEIHQNASPIHPLSTHLNVSSCFFSKSFFNNLNTKSRNEIKVLKCYCNLLIIYKYKLNYGRHSLSKKEQSKYYSFFRDAFLPVTYFLTDKKYPLSFTIVPSSLVPLSHPSFLISISGTIIVYLYFVFPLYSYAFAFCIIIKSSIQHPIYKYGTIKFIYSYSISIMATNMKDKIDIKEMINTRKARGMILLEEGIEPTQLDHKTWIIPSQSGNGTYTVKYHLQPNRHWTCTCPDFEHRGVPCKHIHAVKVWSNLKDKFEQIGLKIKQNIKINEELEVSCCKHCYSTDFYKYGKKNGKQIYKCKSCNRKFVNNVDFENMKYNPKVIALTLDLYFRGLSLRKISSHLKEFYNLDVTHMSIYNWIEKYIGIMNEYANGIAPDIGTVWHTDEMMVNIGGSWEYLWNVIDENTRFQLASVVSTERKVRDARMVFQKAKKNCGNRKPKYIVTDGLPAYRRAIKKEFITNDDSTEHIWNVGLQHHPNNNHVERLHGTIRNREKTMRGVKKTDSKIIDGHRLYYNFIKPHESLDGKTPSEKAGITIEGDNKWLTLIRNAVKYDKAKARGEHH